MGLLAGCVAAPSASPAPTTATTSSEVSVVVPAVSDTIHSKLLFEDPTLVIKRSDELPLAPSSFAVVGDQVIINDYLQDTFDIYQGGKRIIEFDNPEPIGDFAVRDAKYYTLESGDVVGVYSRTAKGLKRDRTIKLPTIKPGGSQYNSLYFEGPNLIAEADARILVDGPGPIRAQPETTDLDHAFQLTDGNINATVPLKYSSYVARRIALTDQYTFYSVDAWNDKHPTQDQEAVLQFTLNGQLVHTYAVYRRGSTAEGRQFVVADDKLYQMWISNKTVKVFLIEPNG
jgi:hypothetical protein